MVQFSGGYSGKPAWQLQLEIWESSVEPGNNRSYVNWALFVYRGNGDTPYNSEGSAYGVTAPGGFSGTFPAFNYTNIAVGGRYQIASGGAWQNHSANGTYSLYATAYHNSGTTLGNASNSGWLDLTTTTVAPGTPTGFSATYVSDTQVSVNWTNNSQSNGVPTGNDINTKTNNGPFGNGISISAASSVTRSAAPNQKLQYEVRAWNGSGPSGWTGVSNAVYTTPASPSGASATKTAGLDIVVGFTSNVAYTEHTHEVWHGVVSGGVTTWDGAALATLASGVVSYTHGAPNASQVHVYQVRSRAGALASGYSTTNSVQLLVAPNKPTVPSMLAFSDKASSLVAAWTHNPVDTSPQKAYEFSFSTNGGSTWSTSGKITGTQGNHTVAANAYAANVALTMRVRTWGSATTGGSDGTGASAWSDLRTVTYKTIPVATITTPANGSVLNDATVRATLGFSQAEGATFVTSTVRLMQGATLLEELDSNLLVGITLATQVQNGVSYSILARVQDSNGLWSAWVTTTFSVTYLAPVPAIVTLTYLPNTGYGQIDLTLSAPGAGQSAAATVTITRKINGVVETVVQDYPAASQLTFLDTTPTVHGTNTYTITTTSALGAKTTVVTVLVTTECRRAFLSKGVGFSVVGAFGGNLSVSESLNVASDTIEAAGRIKPIGLYGSETSVSLKVSSFIFEGFGSTLDELRSILLMPGKACYRDGSGRRVFGSANGSVSYSKADRGDLSFNLTETS